MVASGVEEVSDATELAEVTTVDVIAPEIEVGEDVPDAVENLFVPVVEPAVEP